MVNNARLVLSLKTVNRNEKRRNGHVYVIGIELTVVGGDRWTSPEQKSFHLRINEAVSGFATCVMENNVRVDPIQVQEGRMTDGGFIAGKINPESLIITVKGEVADPIEFTVCLVSTRQVNSWPDNNNADVKTAAAFEQTLRYKNLNHLEFDSDRPESSQTALTTLAPANQQRENQNGEFTITIRYGERTMKVDQLTADTTIRSLKLLIFAQSLTLPGWSRVPFQNQQIIFNGTILDDETKFSEVPNLIGGSTLQLHYRPDNVPVPRPQQQQQQRQQDRPGAQLSPIANQFNQLKICNRNFEACVRAAQRNTEPSSRPRYNEPNGAPIQVPRVVDLGDVTEELASTMMRWSHQLEELGHQLVEDRQLPSDPNHPEYQLARRRIQNNLDACRFLSPGLALMGRFVVPIARNPEQGGGRILGAIQPRQRQQQPQENN